MFAIDDLRLFTLRFYITLLDDCCFEVMVIHLLLAFVDGERSSNARLFDADGFFDIKLESSSTER